MINLNNIGYIKASTNIIDKMNLIALNREFFAASAVEVAKSLLGQILVFNQYQGIITETESYRGLDDPASHAHKGITPRSRVMFGPPGFSYVYFIYGMYHCLNVVTEEVDSPSAVLIRGLKLILPYEKILNGPGKLCRELSIDKRHNNIDLIDNSNFYIARGENVINYASTPRIGIKTATDKLWRFVVK